MSSQPAIILHNALLREFYTPCDRCCEIWGVRKWHPLISERQDIKRTRLFLQLKYEKKSHWEPFSHQKKVKRCGFLAKILKMEPPEGNLSPLEPWLVTVNRELSLHRIGADGDRHPSSAAIMMATRSLAGLAQQSVSPKICWNALKQSQKGFFITYCCHLYAWNKTLYLSPGKKGKKSTEMSVNHAESNWHVELITLRRNWIYIAST